MFVELARITETTFIYINRLKGKTNTNHWGGNEHWNWGRLETDYLRNLWCENKVTIEKAFRLVSKRDVVKTLWYDNEFDLHGNENEDESKYSFSRQRFKMIRLEAKTKYNSITALVDTNSY